MGKAHIVEKLATLSLGQWCRSAILASNWTLSFWWIHKFPRSPAAVSYQMHCLRQIRRLVGQEVTAHMVSASILSLLDYWNSVLAGLY